MCVIGTFHQPLPATATANPVTQAIATMTSPCASRKLRSLGPSARTRASAPANHAQLSLRCRLLPASAGRASRGPIVSVPDIYTL